MNNEINAIAEEVKNCTKCPLYETRKNAVPGEGDSSTKIMFVGEAPGFYEDVQGRPFVGAAGKLLTELIENILCIPRPSVFITNIVKCRPPENRDPLPNEIETCSPYLDRQIMLIKPKVLVTLGRHSSSYILSKAGIKIKGITDVRGRIFSLFMFDILLNVMPTLHPAAALYNPQLKVQIEEDFRKLKNFVNTSL
ncbi:MAG: type-4 uracil-DNA glycosylase [Nitrososphaeria archaeon]|nr:type-4 uracil-DNA glycosylase [Nitrososphaeria archaeon]